MVAGFTISPLRFFFTFARVSALVGEINIQQDGSGRLIAASEQQPGSWWTDWQKWITKLNDEKVPARDPAKGKFNELATMLPLYYAARGWDSEGRPTAETKARLGL